MLFRSGYLGKFTEWLFVQKKSIESLRDLYKKITDSKISKPINDFDTPEDVIDYIVRETADTAVNQMVLCRRFYIEIYLNMG